MIFKTYKIDPKHSQLHFEFEHLGGVSVLTARMTGFSGALKVDAGIDSRQQLLSFNVSIDALSISSALVTFDPLLKSAAMFAIDSFPVISLSVHPFTASGSNTNCRLMMRKIEKSCTFQLWSARNAVNRRGFNIVGIRGSIDVSCSAFGMTGTPSLGDTVRLAVNIEATDEPFNEV